MKSLKNLLRLKAGTLLLALSGTVLISSCTKEDAGGEPVYVPSSSLKAYNLAADRSSVSFSIGTIPLGTPPLAFMDASSGYIPINMGMLELKAVNVDNNQTITSLPYNFAENASYSAFLVGYNGEYKNVIVQDNSSPLQRTAGKAWVRYVNAVADQNAMSTVSLGEMSETVGFGAASAFRPVNATSTEISISSIGNFGTSQTTVFEENKIYTVLFVGVPGSNNPELAPQAKIMVNGIAE
jgi:hypothetical protein